MKYLSSIKQLFIFGLGVLTLWFMSAQFVIPSGIDNALQIIQRVLITTSWTSEGEVIMDMNGANNNIYLNPFFLEETTPYGQDLVLTLDPELGFISFTSLTDFIENNSFNTNGDWTFDGDTTFNSWVTFNTGPVNFNDVTTNFSGWIVDNTNNTINHTNSTVNYGTSTTITYASGTTIIFSTWVVLTGATMPWPAPADVSQSLSFDDAINELTISDWNTVQLPFWSLMGNAVDNANKILGTLNDYTLRIFAGGLERMTILRNNWYVWINNTNPEKQLHVNGAIASSVLFIDTNDLDIDMNLHRDFFWWLWLTWWDRLLYNTIDRQDYYSSSDKAFFFPIATGGTWESNFWHLWSVSYLVFIDAQDVNHVVLQPQENEYFFVGWFINGVAWQHLNVAQKPHYYNASGSSTNGSFHFYSNLFEANGGDLDSSILQWTTNTFDSYGWIFDDIISQRSVSTSFIYPSVQINPFQHNIISYCSKISSTTDDMRFWGSNNSTSWWNDSSRAWIGSISVKRWAISPCSPGISMFYDGWEWLTVFGI